MFADIYNTLLFNKNLIQPDRLTDCSTETIYKEECGELRYQNRDTVKKYGNSIMTCTLLGIENQTEIDTDMPIRIMGYDYASYRKQIDEGKKRFPVISIVLYFGKNEWKKPLSLKELLNISKEFEPYVSDYKIHVFNVARLPKEIRQKFTSDFKIVADFFAEKNNPDYAPKMEKITHVEAVLHFLRVFTNDIRYDSISTEMVRKQQEGKVITMCDFLDRVWNSGETAGMEKGIEKGLILGMEKGKILAYFDMGLTKEEISDKVGLPIEQVCKILNESLELV